MDEEECEDHQEPEGVEGKQPPYKPCRKHQGEPHDKPRNEHDQTEDGHSQEEHLLTGIVFTHLRDLVHVPQVTSGYHHPLQVFRHGKNASLMPPHLDGQKKGQAEEEPCKVVEILSDRKSTHKICYGVE